MVLCVSLAHANAAVPLLVQASPFLLFSLIPIILIEAAIILLLLKCSWGRALVASILANLVSTLLGWLPIGLIDLSLQSARSGTVLIDPKSVQIWFSNVQDEWEALGLCLIPAFALSVVIELVVVGRWLKETSRTGLRMAVLLANSVTYAAIALCWWGWFGTFEREHKSMASLAESLAEQMQAAKVPPRKSATVTPGQNAPSRDPMPYPQVVKPLPQWPTVKDQNTFRQPKSPSANAKALRLTSLLLRPEAVDKEIRSKAVHLVGWPGNRDCILHTYEWDGHSIRMIGTIRNGKLSYLKLWIDNVAPSDSVGDELLRQASKFFDIPSSHSLLISEPDHKTGRQPYPYIRWSLDDGTSVAVEEDKPGSLKANVRVSKSSRARGQSP